MNGIKAPTFLRTHTLFKRLGDLLTFGKVAQSCGKEIQTAEAWGREPASNANPAGTGRNNPADCILRLIGLAHKEGDRALAREIAETFPEYVDYLEGVVTVQDTPIDELAGRSVREHGEAIFHALNRRKPNYAKAYTEIVQAEIALADLKKWVRNEMQPLRAQAQAAISAKNGDSK